MTNPGSTIYCCSLAGKLCSHHNLNPGDSAIRVLDIEPAAAFDDPIVVQTRIISFNSGEKYQTLSYCWGELVLDGSITCNGAALAVTSHLEAGLRRIRSLKLPNSGTIWIDAICINQGGDLREKSAQVQLMANIYKQSSRLLIWLGEAAEEATGTLQQIVQTRHVDHASASAVQKLLGNAWFSRRWILQEVLLSPAACRHVLYGNIKIKLEQFLYLYAQYLTLSPSEYKDLPSQWLLKHDANQQAGSFSRNVENYPSLLENLYTFRRSVCHLEADLVYTLLWLSRDRLQVMEVLAIDYALQTRILHQSLATHYLLSGTRREKVLILVWATCTRSTRNSDWPSWVPDWTIRQEYRSKEHEKCFDIVRRSMSRVENDQPKSMLMDGRELRITAHLLLGKSPPKWFLPSRERKHLPPWPQLHTSEEYMFVRDWISGSRYIVLVVRPGTKEGTYKLVSCFLAASPDSVEPWPEDLAVSIPELDVRYTQKSTIIIT